MKTILKNIVVYGAAGPPISALALCCLFIPFLLFSEPGANGWTNREILARILGFPILALLAIPTSYVLGGPQAVLVGAVVGLAEQRWGKPKIWIPIIAAAFSWALWGLVGVRPTFFPLGGIPDMSELVGLPIHILGAIAVWSMLRL